MPKEYLNILDLKRQAEGDERRLEILNGIVEYGTFLPKTVEYKDIDESFKEWVDSLTITSDDGKEFPTMTLFSNQRFTEYTQSWQFLDTNNNLLLNFKSVTRENNPQLGKIQGGLWNIPGDRFYLMKQKRVLDDNGTESIVRLEMKQPVAIDLQYKVSIFTTMYKSINDFNTMINKLFASRQHYIRPNGHYMPMTLESISDESQYNIDDRQFYSQSFKIKVMAYIITEDDYRVIETPLKMGSTFGLPRLVKKASVEIEEGFYTPITMDNKCGVKTVWLKTGKVNVKEEPNCTQYFYMPLSINVLFEGCTTKAKFTVDTDIIITGITLYSVGKNFRFTINDDETTQWQNKFDELLAYLSENGLTNGDEVKIDIFKKPGGGTPTITFNGYNPNVKFQNEAEYWNSIAMEEAEEECDVVEAYQ